MVLNLVVFLFKFGVLEKYGVELIGVKLLAIEMGEDWELFKEVMVCIGVFVCLLGIVSSIEEVW